LIDDGCLDAVISTMVMEHVPDERAYLAEIGRILRPGGRAYMTTVFKKPWAWYFRKRDGESVLDTSHLREYTDVDSVRRLVTDAGFSVVALERRLLWFPLLDPLLFRLGHRMSSKHTLLRVLRAPKVPIPGYYSLELVVERTGDTHAV
jgi:SAM-dependent methyltransferase